MSEPLVVPKITQLKRSKRPCIGCGSIISGHHTTNCDIGRGGKDLVPLKGTTWWIYAGKPKLAEEFLFDHNANLRNNNNEHEISHSN